MVRTVLSEGEFKDVLGGVILDSKMGVLLFAKERRDVMGRIGGGGLAASPRRSSGNAGRGESHCPRQGNCGPPLGSVGRNEVRR